MGLLGHLLLVSLFLPFCFSADSIGQYCSKTFKSTQTQTNINHVLSDLVASATVSGFATSTSGEGNNTVYGLAQCRGDVVGTDDCSACINSAAQKLPTACPNNADARIWYDYCFMRYDTDDFIGVADTGVGVIYINLQNATDRVAFDKKAGEVMTKARVDAGSGGLGREKERFTPYVTIYGLAECTRDLRPVTCDDCLALAVEKIPDYCRYRKGCQINYSSCRVRYEVYPFFFPLDPSSAPAGRYVKAMLYP